MTVLITLSGVGSSAGPTFNLYASTDGITYAPIISDITKTDLEAGYTATVPFGTISIKATSVGQCTNSYTAPNLYLCTLDDVTIGTQIWTACNLNVETYSDGTPIPQVTTAAEWENYGQNGIGAWCYYDFNPTIGATYGKLYNGYTVMGIWNEASKLDINQRKQLAPTGYHIPSETECATLFDYLGGENVAGGKLKETGDLHWISDTATNSSGFTALGGGQQFGEGTFEWLRLYGYFWGSTIPLQNNLSSFVLPYSGNSVNTTYGNNISGRSVRLIKD